MPRPDRAGLAVLLIAGLSGTALGSPRNLSFGPLASELAFRAYGMGLWPIDAHFSRFEGALRYDADNRQSCDVELRAQVASLIADDTDLRDTIAGPEFLDAASFPTLAYTGRCQAPDRLDGTLTMHGVTRPFTLSLTWKHGMVEAEGRLERADWGMTARPLLGGRTIRIRVVVPLPGN